MNDLRPLHRTDHVLGALGGRRPLPPGDQDPVTQALQAWVREVDAAVGPEGRGRARRAWGRRAAGGLVLTALLTGSSVAAALTGAQVPVLSTVGAAVVHLVPGSPQTPGSSVPAPTIPPGTDTGPVREGDPVPTPDPAHPGQGTVPVGPRERAVPPVTTPLTPAGGEASPSEAADAPRPTGTSEVASPAGPRGSAPPAPTVPPGHDPAGDSPRPTGPTLPAQAPTSPPTPTDLPARTTPVPVPPGPPAVPAPPPGGGPDTLPPTPSGPTPPPAAPDRQP